MPRSFVPLHLNFALPQIGTLSYAYEYTETLRKRRKWAKTQRTVTETDTAVRKVSESIYRIHNVITCFYAFWAEVSSCEVLQKKIGEQNARSSYRMSFTEKRKRSIRDLVTVTETRTQLPTDNLLWRRKTY